MIVPNVIKYLFSDKDKELINLFKNIEYASARKGISYGKNDYYVIVYK